MTPPASFINIFSGLSRSLQRATYRNALAHLLIVLLSARSALRAANNCSKWVRIPVEGQLRKFKRVPQKLLGFSPHFVVRDDLQTRLLSTHTRRRECDWPENRPTHHGSSQAVAECGVLVLCLWVRDVLAEALSESARLWSSASRSARYHLMYQFDCLFPLRPDPRK